METFLPATVFTRSQFPQTGTEKIQSHYYSKLESNSANLAIFVTQIITDYYLTACLWSKSKLHTAQHTHCKFTTFCKAIEHSKQWLELETLLCLKHLPVQLVPEKNLEPIIITCVYCLDNYREE